MLTNTTKLSLNSKLFLNGVSPTNTTKIKSKL
jgi:hypothetical protein